MKHGEDFIASEEVLRDCGSCHYGDVTAASTPGAGVMAIVFCQRHGGCGRADCEDWLERGSSADLQPGDCVEAAGPLHEYYYGDIVTAQGDVGIVLAMDVPEGAMPGQVMVDFDAGPTPFVRRWLRKLVDGIQE